MKSFIKAFQKGFVKAKKDVLSMTANHWDTMAKQAETKDRKAIYRQYAKETRRERSEVGFGWPLLV